MKHPGDGGRRLATLCSRRQPVMEAGRTADIVVG
jgi:hypothetical protein